ncbi:MAG: hypothetical protein VXV96_10060 [Bdellovibrionota bacterium]|nr:hypothetical protein [Bdellovibrionota bacterium]
MMKLLVVLSFLAASPLFAQVQGPSAKQVCNLSATSPGLDHDNYFYYRFLEFTVSTPVLKQKGYACAAIKKDAYAETVDYLVISADDGSDDIWITRDQALRGHNIFDNAINDYRFIKKQVIVRLETQEKPALEGQSRTYINDLIFLRNFVTGREDDYRKASFTAFYDREANKMRAIYKGMEVSGMLIRIGFNLKFNKVTYYPVGKDPIKLDISELPRVAAP